MEEEKKIPTEEDTSITAEYNFATKFMAVLGSIGSKEAIDLFMSPNVVIKPYLKTLFIFFRRNYQAKNKVDEFKFKPYILLLLKVISTIKAENGVPTCEDYEDALNELANGNTLNY